MFMKIKLQEFTCIIRLKEVVIMTRVGMGIKKNNNNEAEKIKKTSYKVALFRVARHE